MGRKGAAAVTSSGAARHLRPRPEIFSGGEIEAEYAADVWHAARLGIPARRGRDTARFGVIEQGWFREAIKAWSRFRLASGYAFNTVDSGAQSLARFSLFLSEHPDVDGFDKLTRQLLEHFLVWMPTQTQWGTATCHHTLTFVKVLLDWVEVQHHPSFPKRGKLHLLAALIEQFEVRRLVTHLQLRCHSGIV
jgi:hypothetical protein